MNADDGFGYAWNEEISLAYRVYGDGPVDLVYLQGYLSNVELNHEIPACARFLNSLSRGSRLIVTDRRGLGCSERFTPADTPPIELLVDDLLALLDTVSSDRAVLFATGDCGPIACLTAAMHPDRISGLVLYSTFATLRKSDEIWWGDTDAEIEATNVRIRESLGDGSWLKRTAPSIFGGDRPDTLAQRYERLSLTPGSCYSEGVKFGETDIRPILSSIHVPVLVLQRRGDTYSAVEGSRYIADKIAGARMEELEGDDHLPWAGDQDAVSSSVLDFVATVHDEETELERSLATVLITDIVNSTKAAIELGDQKWQEVRSQHDRIVRAHLARYRGREIKTLGDGFLATFDGPARGAHCAKAIADSTRELGIEIRAGVHIGEIMLEGNDVSGLGVVICERIASLAGPSEVLVSSTIKDLVSGSKLKFEDAGSHNLKGLDDPWQIFRVSV